MKSHDQATPTGTACEQKDLLPEALFFSPEALFFSPEALFSETHCFNVFLLVSAR